MLLLVNQLIAAPCSSLQLIAAHCSSLLLIAARCSSLQLVAACCSLLQLVAAHCSSLQLVAARLQLVAARLQLFAARCNSKEFNKFCNEFYIGRNTFKQTIFFITCCVYKKILASNKFLFIARLMI